MEKVRLGQTGLQVSKLSFGGIPIQRLSEEDAVAVVRACRDAGITFFDTAHGYTTSEERIGKALAGNRDGIFVATKSPARTAEEVQAHIELSLKRLQTDYIDLFQFHNVADLATLTKLTDPKGPWAVVEAARAAGKIRHIGITSHSMDTAKEAVKTGKFETLMFPFNVITAEAAEELLPLCRQHDVGFIAMKPLSGGMLEEVDIALRYLYQFDDVVTLLGMQAAEEVVQAMEVLRGLRRFTDSERREMEELRVRLGPKFCRRCDYCQPCAEKIPISTVMFGSSFLKRMPPERLFMGGPFDKAFTAALDCSKCGECETRCPYHLPIPDMIEEQSNLFEAARRRYQAILAAG